MESARSSRITPFIPPAAEIINRMETIAGPRGPRKVCAALAATGSASRCKLELAVRISSNGSAQKYARFARRIERQHNQNADDSALAEYCVRVLTSPATMGM